MENKEEIFVHLVSGSHDRANKISDNDDFIIASSQTLERNLDYLKNNFLDTNNDIFLVIDEVHHFTAKNI